MNERTFSALVDQCTIAFIGTAGKRATVDRTFWIGIGIGAILSLVASIVANLFNSSINRAVTLANRSSRNRGKKRDLRRYLQLEMRITNPELDRRMMLQDIMRLLVFGMTGTIMSIVAFTLFFAMLMIDADKKFGNDSDYQISLALTSIFAVFCDLIAISFMAITEQIHRI